MDRYPQTAVAPRPYVLEDCGFSVLVVELNSVQNVWYNWWLCGAYSIAVSIEHQ